LFIWVFFCKYANVGKPTVKAPKERRLSDAKRPFLYDPFPLLL
jgi:hypothetical protein